jgi:hypothetical protein
MTVDWMHIPATVALQLPLELPRLPAHLPGSHQDAERAQISAQRATEAGSS